MDVNSIKELFVRIFARIDQASAEAHPHTLVPKGRDEILVLREGFKVERLPAGPSARPVRTHTFDDIESFSAFVRRHWPEAEKAEIFIDGDGTIQATNANVWSFDRVVCKLAPDLAAKSWGALWGVPMEQKIAFREINRRRESVKGSEQLLAGIRMMEIKANGNFSGHLNDRGVYEFVATSNGKEVVSSLPLEIVIEIPIFRGQTGRYKIEVEVGLNVERNDKPPIITLTPRNLAEVTQQAIEERATALVKLLNEDGRTYQVYRGVLKFSEPESDKGPAPSAPPAPSNPPRR